MTLNLSPETVVLGLRHLHPSIDLARDALVLAEPGGVRLVWHLPGPPPSEAQLTAAAELGAAREELRATLTEYQGLLDERYRLFTRALANGNAAAQTEIQDEIQLILAALQEVRDALSAA